METKEANQAGAERLNWDRNQYALIFDGKQKPLNYNYHKLNLFGEVGFEI